MNIKYIANDGTEFWSAEECYTYELKDKAYESKDIIVKDYRFDKYFDPQKIYWAFSHRDGKIHRLCLTNDYEKITVVDSYADNDGKYKLGKAVIKRRIVEFVSLDVPEDDNYCYDDADFLPVEHWSKLFHYKVVQLLDKTLEV